MIHRLAADAILLFHLAFVLFALFGGLFCLYRPIFFRIHPAALLWGVAVEWGDWLCPLTPLENFFREKGGEAVYQEDFIERYLAPPPLPRGAYHRVALASGRHPDPGQPDGVRLRFPEEEAFTEGVNLSFLLPCPFSVTLSDKQFPPKRKTEKFHGR